MLRFLTSPDSILIKNGYKWLIFCSSESWWFKFFEKKYFQKRGVERGVDILYWVKYLDIQICVYFQHFWVTLCLYVVVSSWTNSQEKHPPFHPPFSKKKNDIFFWNSSLYLQNWGFSQHFGRGCQLGGTTERNHPPFHPPFSHHWKVHTLNFCSSYYHFLRKCIVLAVQTQILKTH